MTFFNSLVLKTNRGETFHLTFVKIHDQRVETRRLGIYIMLYPGRHFMVHLSYRSGF